LSESCVSAASLASEKREPYFLTGPNYFESAKDALSMKQFSRNFLLLSMLTTCLVSAPISHASPEAVKKGVIYITESDLKWKPLPGMPEGAQIALITGDLSKPERYIFRLKLPDGYVIPSHWHTNDEETTVISGTFNMGIGDNINKSEAKVLNAGDFALVSGRVHHYVWSTGETIIQDEGMGPRDTIFVNPEELKKLFKNK